MSRSPALLPISVALNVVLLAALGWHVFVRVGVGTYYRRHVAPREDFLADPYYRATVERYRDLNRRIGGDAEYVVFAGDSLIEQFQVSELLPGARVVNRGVGRDTTRGLLERLDETVANIPRGQVFLLIGSNDLDYRGVEEATSNLEKIVRRLGPEKTFVISVPPCGDRAENGRIRSLNASFAAVARRMGSRFLDIYPMLLGPEGVLRPGYTYDGVHLNPRGYDVVLDAVRPLVRAGSPQADGKEAATP